MHSQDYLPTLYKESLALLTDLYALTMAYGYWKKGLADRQAVFYLSFRRKPFNGEFALTAGLETFLSFLEHFQYSKSDLAYLESLKNSEGDPLFEKAFLEYLEALRFSCDVDAMVEGTVAFPYEPIVRVQGSILQAQLLESPLLNIINFQSLIATKAARVCFAARPDRVMEFGMRRAQGIDGAIAASRAAFIGGCDGTSHVLAGKIFGIPVHGTLAHSWVMAFDDEELSFDAYSEVMPHGCVFLIDTYDTIQGAKKAIATAKKMRKKGVEMIGVRLDSGDLAHLSIAIRKMLDEAGFKDAKIMASNELDESIIRDLKHQGAQISIWGVGTNLVTAKDQPALDGVYKLSAIQDKAGKWIHKMKVSEQLAKVTTPGILQVRRYFNNQENLLDMVYDIQKPLKEKPVSIHPFDPSQVHKITGDMQYKELLIPIVRKGKRIYPFHSLQEIRKYAAEELSRFHPGMRRFLYPQPYFVGLEASLHEEKIRVMRHVRKQG